MSNPDSFFDNDDIEYGVCPSCRFKLGLHSAKQIIGCAINDIRSVLGVEKV